MPRFIHHVEMKMAAEDAAARLGRIDSWCSDWQIGFRVLERLPGSDTIRIAFDDQRLANAFTSHFGGVLVGGTEIDDALAAGHEADACDRMCRGRS